MTSPPIQNICSCAYSNVALKELKLQLLFILKLLVQTKKSTSLRIGPLHGPVTWYKITHTGAQVAQWDFQNNATRTSPPGPAFVLEVPLRNLRTSMSDCVPCDRIVQRAYF